MEGGAPEYWSPPSGWKSTGNYYSRTLAGFNASFLDEFCHGVSGDMEYLRTERLNVTWWGLQNEHGSGAEQHQGSTAQPQAAGTTANASSSRQGQ
jgi:hypothetical protein